MPTMTRSSVPLSIQRSRRPFAEPFGRRHARRAQLTVFVEQPWWAQYVPFRQRMVARFRASVLVVEHPLHHVANDRVTRARNGLQPFTLHDRDASAPRLNEPLF